MALCRRETEVKRALGGMDLDWGQDGYPERKQTQPQRGETDQRAGRQRRGGPDPEEGGGGEDRFGERETDLLGDKLRVEDRSRPWRTASERGG